MSLATVAAQQSAAQASTASATATTAMGSLSGDFQSFLKLLMTQLQNQDPTSPLDTNQFTSQLVQFASVEQQINANTNLTQLITLTQSDQMMQSSSMVGRTVQLDADHMPLQGGKGALNFTAAAAGPVGIAVYTDSGAKVLDTTVAASAGSNNWIWDGKNSQGSTVADGSYRIAVTGTDATGATAGLPFTVYGTVSAVQKNGTSLQLQLGTQTAEFSTVQSVLN
jgi:flagellar basal-body rod modification protein FlgD